jgi:energy-coupling factor transporter transmembrane protein EcfT
VTRTLIHKANPYLWVTLLFLLVSWVFFNNAWVDEDAYIIFRSIEQLFEGNGPVCRPGITWWR